MNILIGCDPEVFVRQKGLMQSAHGLIPGDKKNPFKVDKGAVQVDGMALEFNIDPAATSEEFCLNVETVLHQMMLMVPDYEVVIQPVAHFTKDVMEAQPAEALELGCDPDYNGWTMLQNNKPNSDRPMRTASGHVHIGWTSNQDLDLGFERAGLVAREMDFYLGLGSIFYDEDQERRAMYGNPGCFRVKPYGMEYRTLSNAWVGNRKRMEWVFNNAKNGMERILKGERHAEQFGDISEIILKADKKAAKKILNKIGVEVCNA